MSEANNKSDDLNEDNKDEENQELVKIKYPRSVPFIISNEFCERFNYYGMRTILVLYLTLKLDYDEDTATVLYHSFTTLVYFCCVIGAIISDSWWGKFKTILLLSIVYVAGSSLVSITAIEVLNLPGRTLTLLGLFLIAFGSGGIKPCVAAFGGEQFKMPQQAAQLAIFFSMFYFAVNSGSFVSTAITPILREDVKCFDKDDCYSLAFGVPAILMAVSIMIFVFGKPLYKLTVPSGNMFAKVVKCIANAISTKSKEKNTAPREHWLEYSEKKFGKKLVMETKILLNVLVLYLPLPVFWALFDQQGSRWTFQATRMDGDIGFMTIKPDQMQVVNPFLILVFIPLYEMVFYPLLKYVGIRRPLQKLTIGGILAGVAFVCSALVEMQLEKTYAVLPSEGKAQLRFFNGMNCDFRITHNIENDIPELSLKALKSAEEKYVPITNDESTYAFTFTSTEVGCPNNVVLNLALKSNMASSFFITRSADTLSAGFFEDSPEKSSRGFPLITIVRNFLGSQNVTLNNREPSDFQENKFYSIQEMVPPGDYDVNVNGKLVGTTNVRLGGVYTLIIEERSADSYFMEMEIVTAPNSISMLWLLAQYIIMTLGEVMYSVTGLEFSFTQAPESMKSVLQGCWQLTVGVGNLLVVVIAEARLFDSQKWEFVLFAGLMFVDMAIFAWLATRYKGIPLSELDKIDEEIRRENEEKPSALEFPGTSNGKDDEDSTKEHVKAY